MLDVQAHADESSRYSNTLLVSLNNRIYFRDHPFRGAHGHTPCYVDSGPSFLSTVTPITFAQTQNGRRPQTVTTSTGTGLKLDTVSGAPSIDIEKGSVVEDNSNPRFVLLSQNFRRSVQRLELQSFMNERDSTPNPSSFEEPTVEGLLFLGGVPDCYCNMALTS